MNEAIEQEIKDQKQLMQDDIRTLLAGDDIDYQTVDAVCQVIVDRMNLLMSTVTNQQQTKIDDAFYNRIR